MRNILTLALSFAVCLGLSAQEKVVSWQTDPVDGHRTGVMASNASNVTEAMGSVKGCAYYAPNGKRFRKGTTWIVAKIMLDGGDGYKVAKNAVELIKCNGYLYDTMLAYVQNLTAAGKPIEYQNQNWITILEEGDSK